MKSLGLLLLGLVFYSCNQNVTMDNIEDLKNQFSFDTIYLDDDKIEFSSDLLEKLSVCHQTDSFEVKALDKDKVLNFLELLDRKFETDMFTNSVKVITGKSVTYKTKIPQKKFHSDMNTQQLSIMEWHFNSSDTVEKLDSLLKQLDNGRINITKAPHQCDWIKKDNKLYVISYIEQIERGEWLDDIKECIAGE